MSGGFSPGDLVRARGREWVVLPGSEGETLHLRPLSGSEADRQVLLPALEREPVRLAHFSMPDAGATMRQDAAALFSDALRLSLRRGAGPFRSAARLGFEPRAYQLVPLLMALRLPVVRLLIADDVGIGKTIEAGLVLRELMDRGVVDRFTVLCPPHLVEQWTEELAEKFDLEPTAVTAASAPRLERALPASETLFHAHPATVVSLDYIKADRRRETFARVSPRFVIVDEAHTCVGTERGRQQRFELLRRLAEDPERHLLLLTATPHSGDEQAFDRLLGLLGPGLATGALGEDAARIRLARHFGSAAASTSRQARRLGGRKAKPAGATRASFRVTKPRKPRIGSATSISHSTMPCSITALASSRVRDPSSIAAGSPSGAPSP